MSRLIAQIRTFGLGPVGTVSSLGEHTKRLMRPAQPRTKEDGPAETGPSTTTCGVPVVRSLLRLDPTPAVRMTVRPFRRPGGVRAGRTCPDQVPAEFKTPEELAKVVNLAELVEDDTGHDATPPAES